MTPVVVLLCSGSCCSFTAHPGQGPKRRSRRASSGSACLLVCCLSVVTRCLWCRRRPKHRPQQSCCRQVPEGVCFCRGGWWLVVGRVTPICVDCSCYTGHGVEVDKVRVREGCKGGWTTGWCFFAYRMPCAFDRRLRQTETDTPHVYITL